MENLLRFVIFWGVWLLVPMLADGVTTLASLLGVLIIRVRNARRTRPSFNYYPRVSVIVPVYNSAATLRACLQSLAAQNYPQGNLEILLINNGSTDHSFEIFHHFQNEMSLRMSWHSIINQGKAWALNAGIYMAQGRYILNVDSDVVLAPDAIRCAIETMESEPSLGSATGSIQVLPPPAFSGPIQQLIASFEFFEYLSAFQVGRQYQTLLQNLYTLSGAFSIFRREVLLNSYLYNNDTVTEDTDLTFDLYERFLEFRIGCISTAVACVHPTATLSALYAQRVRWQRGQVEVSARHYRLIRRPMWKIFGFSPARTLLVDHTLSFPRLVWTFLLPALTLFGYSASLVLQAFIILYLFYVMVDVAWLGVAWLGSDGSVRQRLRAIIWLMPLMPLYRMLIFWFRFSGFLYAVAEPGVWQVTDPINQSRLGLRDLQQRVRRLLFGRFQ